MTLERASATFFGCLLTGAASLAAYLITGQPGYKALSAAAGCSALLCSGYIMGRLDS